MESWRPHCCKMMVQRRADASQVPSARDSEWHAFLPEACKAAGDSRHALAHKIW